MKAKQIWLKLWKLEYNTVYQAPVKHDQSQAGDENQGGGIIRVVLSFARFQPEIIKV